MARVFSLLMVLIATSLTMNTHAQVENYLKKKMNQASKRAQQKADERLTREMNEAVDKQVDKAFDAALEGEEEKPDSVPPASEGSADYDARSAAMLKAMGISMDAANVKESYSYTGDIRMVVQTWDGKGNTDGPINYTTYMNEDHSGFAMEFNQEEAHSTIIFDYLEGSMIILTENDGQKTGMVTQYQAMVDTLSNYNDDMTEEETEMPDYAAYNDNLKKTGRTKTIAGYRCDEYVYEDEESHTSLWMTDDLPADLWANMLNSNYIAAANVGYYGGFVMEMEQTQKSDNSRTTMEVLDVNPNKPSSVSTSGYQIMSLGGAAMEGNE